MAGETTITINQTLHGYRGGHRLLSSSVELSDIEKRFMLLMSDYSGSGIEKGFTEYLTGYPIPSSKFYVFAKTWYANEMNRPGCVWTHSLLIDVTDLWSIRDMRVLLNEFNRPESTNDHEFYSFSKPVLNIPVFFSYADFNDTFFGISCELYDRSELGLVLLGESSLQYENEILLIWNWQWPRLKRSFTFSTGSLSLRKFDELPFDLQVLPAKRERSVSIGERDIVNMVDMQGSVCSNEWIDDYRHIELSALQNYMVKYGSDVAGNRGNFVALLKSFFFFSKESNVELNSIKEFFRQTFIHPDQARILKVYLIDTLLKRATINGFDVLDLLVSSVPFSGLKWNYSNIVSSLYSRGQLSEFELIEILDKLSEQQSNQEAVLDILVSIDSKIWINKLRLSEEYCSKLLERSQVYESDPSIWSLDSLEQSIWFNAIYKQSSTRWDRVVNSMLQAKSDLFAHEVAEINRSATLFSIINWVSINKEQLSTVWYSILKDCAKDVTLLIMRHEILNRELMQIFLDTSSPHNDLWSDISWGDVSSFLLRVNATGIEPEITGIYTFLITACFNNNFSQPELLISELFQPLHDKLNYQNYDFNSWERFKWDMGKEIYGLIQQNIFSYYLQDKNLVPDWDRCEFLRRSLVAVYLKFGWNPITLVNTVSDRNTFEKVVEFGLKLNNGYRLFERIFYSMRNSDKYSVTFHYKVLKNALK